MGSWLNFPAFAIEEAQARGNDIYEVLIKDWGVTSASARSTDQWPPLNQMSVPVSLAGIAIGPRSTVDRAWVTYNLQKSAKLGIDDLTIPQLTPRIRQVSIASPLLFTQAAAPGTNNVGIHSGTGNFNELLSMVQKGSLYIWPQGQGVQTFNPGEGTEQTEVYTNQQASTVYSQFNDINGNLQDLFDLAPESGGNPGQWLGPLLHLILYLKAPIISPPTKRPPIMMSVRGLHPGGTAPTAAWATFGRRGAHLVVMSDAPCDFRVAALRSPVTASQTNTQGIAQEEPVDAVTGVAANTPTVLSTCAGKDLYADYLLLYASAGNITYSFSAYD